MALTPEEIGDSDPSEDQVDEALDDSWGNIDFDAPVELQELHRMARVMDKKRKTDNTLIMDDEEAPEQAPVDSAARAKSDEARKEKAKLMNMSMNTAIAIAYVTLSSLCLSV